MTSVCPSCSLESLSTAGLFLAQHFQSRPSFKEPANLLLYVRRKILTGTTHLQKTLQLVASRSHTHNLPAKQRAPRSQKRAGAETTLRTAWIERPIFSRFCLDDPSAGRGSNQVPEAAVVRDVWSRSLLTFRLLLIRLLGRVEPKR